MLDYQGEVAELEGEDKTRPGDKLQGVLEATENINLNDETQNEMEERPEERGDTIQHAEPNKKHPGDALQADIPKRPKTEDETTEESGATVLPTEMEQETETPRKTCDKEDSQDVDHTSTPGQGEE